ncbi:MAG: hypothetical protein GX306_00550 [Clostridiales bacterium]|nr:hypothetical protein [Clostridiales bacterium]
MTSETGILENQGLTILRHELFKERIDHDCYTPARIEVAVRNISASTIARVIFEAKFYDINGLLLDTIRHQESDLKSNTSRNVIIYSKNEHSRIIKNYDLNVVKVITAAQEKVQFCSHEVKIHDNGDEEFFITVKNISNEKTDSSVIATFFNSYKENIGTKVIILRGLEPDKTRRSSFIFKPQGGDKIRTYNFDIGDIEE